MQNKTNRCDAGKNKNTTSTTSHTQRDGILDVMGQFIACVVTCMMKDLRGKLTTAVWNRNGIK